MRRSRMKLSGYERTEGGRLLDLSEVTLSVDATTARALGEFLIRCAEDMQAQPAWEHAHFDPSGAVDLIVFNATRS